MFNCGKDGHYRQTEEYADPHPAGRWPANLILQHAPGCNGACVEGCAVRALGEQSGVSVSKASQRGPINSGQMAGLSGHLPTRNGVSTERGHDDTGTAARFFFQADYVAERLEAADAVFYCAKASTAEREAGLDPLQAALIGSDDAFEETSVDDGRQTPIDNPYLRGETTRRNVHPCLKPLSLTRYLSTLLLPPAAYAPRRILVPFAGVGSEYIGAMLAGWEEIVGIEIDAQYAAIAEARIAYWAQMRHKFDRGQPIKVTAVREQDQPTLFDL